MDQPAKAVKSGSKAIADQLDKVDAVLWPIACPVHGVRGLRYMTDGTENPNWQNILHLAKTDPVLAAKLEKHGLLSPKA